MPRRRGIALFLVVAVLLAAIWMVQDKSRAEFAPRAKLTVLGYEQSDTTSFEKITDKENWEDAATPSLLFSTSPPNPGEQVKTNAGVLLARVKLENIGIQPIGFASFWGDVPYYWCRIQRTDGWARCSGYHLSGTPGMLEVGKAVHFSIALPPDVTAWQFAFRSFSPGPGLRTGLRWYNRGWRGRISQMALYALPRGAEAFAEIRSDAFFVSLEAAGQSQELHQMK